MYCLKCGKELPDGSQFCSYCGTEQAANQQTSDSVQTNEPKITNSAHNQAYQAPIRKAEHSAPQTHGASSSKKAILAVAGVLVVIVIIILIANGGSAKLIGTWNGGYEYITFTKDGKLLSSNGYEYEYKTEGDELYINYGDFFNDGQADWEGPFAYKIEGDTLLLTIGGSTRSLYRMGD